MRDAIDQLRDDIFAIACIQKQERGQGPDDADPALPEDPEARGKSLDDSRQRQETGGGGGLTGGGG